MTPPTPVNDIGTISEGHLKLLVQSAVDDAMRERDAALNHHMAAQFEKMTSTFLSAFPNNDPGEHRRAHEREIANAAGWEKMRADVISKLMTGGVWALMAWVAMAVWEYFRTGVHK